MMPSTLASGTWLLPEDWPGYPMRKDYEFPDEYQGIPLK